MFSGHPENRSPLPLQNLTSVYSESRAVPRSLSSQDFLWLRFCYLRPSKAEPCLQGDSQGHRTGCLSR